MLRLYPFFLVGLTFILYGPPSRAEDILQVYRDAALNDPTLAASAANLQATRETKPQARALLLPNVNALAEGARSFNVRSSSLGGDRNFNSHQVGVQLTQPIFNQSSLVRLRQADSTISQAEAEFASAEQDLLLRTAEGYFGVLEALDTLTSVIANKNATAQQLEQANRRFEVGLITITDVFEAQARFDQEVANEIVARNDLANSLEALRTITDKYYDELFELNEKAPFPPPDPADPKAWVKQAMANNPDIRSAMFGVDTSRENINLQKADHYPTLDLNAEYFNTDNGLINQNGQRVGLQLSIPIFQGGAVVSRTREAAYQHEASKETLEGVQRDVVRQAQDSYRGVVASISRIEALDQTRISSKSSVEATEAGFDVGTRTIVDVLNEHRDLFQAERDYSVSRYVYILNFLRLKAAAGELTVKEFEAINAWLVKPKPDQFGMLNKP
jgi:outer membrane protein